MKFDIFVDEIVYVIECGICGEYETTSGSGIKTKKDAEKYFRDKGYKTRKGKTICPSCMEGITESKSLNKERQIGDPWDVRR